MAKQSDPATVFLTNVRLSFPHLFEPTASVKDGKKKYRADFLMDPDTEEGAANIKACENAIRHVSLEKWEKHPMKFKEDRLAFKDGDENIDSKTDAPYDGYAGMMYVGAAKGPDKTGVLSRLPVVDRDKSPLTAEDGRPYGGCYVNALIRFYAVDGKDSGGPGLFCGLEAVQFYKNGKPFGKGEVNTDSIFKDVSGDDGENEDAAPAKTKKRRVVENDTTDDYDDSEPPSRKARNLF